MRWSQTFFAQRPFADRLFCHFRRQRLTLPALALDDIFSNFDKRIVSLGELPRGSWSTPLADLVMLLKLALCTEPKRVLEVGSYRGYTALLLAQHLSLDATIVAVDRHPEHGHAYRQTTWARMIERRVGEIDRAMFAGDQPASYDFIFVDADHSYQAVRHDTELLLPLLAPAGFIVWHDYANWGYYSGQNGVPEYLGELAATRPITRVLGSTLAIHSPNWMVETGRAIFLAATQMKSGEAADPWKENLPRG